MAFIQLGSIWNALQQVNKGGNSFWRRACGNSLVSCHLFWKRSPALQFQHVNEAQKIRSIRDEPAASIKPLWLCILLQMADSAYMHPKPAHACSTSPRTAITLFGRNQRHCCMPSVSLQDMLACSCQDSWAWYQYALLTRPVAMQAWMPGMDRYGEISSASNW